MVIFCRQCKLSCMKNRAYLILVFDHGIARDLTKHPTKPQKHIHNVPLHMCYTHLYHYSVGNLFENQQVFNLLK